MSCGSFGGMGTQPARSQFARLPAEPSDAFGFISGFLLLYEASISTLHGCETPALFLRI